MSLLDHELMEMVAVYWPPGTPNEYGERGYDDPVEIPCYWSTNKSETIDSQGRLVNVSASVYTTTEVTVDGWLWLSTAKVYDAAGTALAEAPDSPPDNQKIKSVAITPDIDTPETMYQASV